MLYSIDAEILSDAFEYGLGITIIKGNNLNLFTSIPTKNGEAISFREDEEMTISYFLGEFHYIFHVEFKESVHEEELDLYKYVINEVAIEKNHRKHKRELVELNALILDSKNMYYATILDISEKGLKIETEHPILKKRIEVYFANKKGLPNKRKGKVMWSKTGSEKYYYGISLK